MNLEFDAKILSAYIAAKSGYYHPGYDVILYPTLSELFTMLNDQVNHFTLNMYYHAGQDFSHYVQTLTNPNSEYFKPISRPSNFLKSYLFITP